MRGELIAKPWSLATHHSDAILVRGAFSWRW